VTALIVDGYNIIHGWPELKAVLGKGPLEEARRLLLVRLSEYSSVTGVDVTVVFDGPRRPNIPTAPAEIVDGVRVHFSGRSGSADHLIERLAYEATRGAGPGAGRGGPPTTPGRSGSRRRGCAPAVRAAGRGAGGRPAARAGGRRRAQALRSGPPSPGS
jgi:hypothetical protein